MTRVAVRCIVFVCFGYLVCPAQEPKSRTEPLWPEGAPGSQGEQPGDVPYTCANVTLAATRLGYKPSVMFEEGIRLSAIAPIWVS